MGIKKYFASADTTITNAFREDLTTRGTGANMGASDVLEVFSIYGQTKLTGSHSDYSSELSRVLIKFPTTEMSKDRSKGLIPKSGSMSWVLKMYNAPHGQTVPRNAKIMFIPCKQDWEEGHGLDMEEYRDTTRDGEGANWMNYAQNKTWNRMGGEYYTASADSAIQYSASKGIDNIGNEGKLSRGYEDIEIDVSCIVEQWIGGSPAGGSKSNYGFGVFLTASQESHWSSSNQPGSTTSPANFSPNYNDLGGAYSLKSVSKAFRGVLHNVHGAKTSYYTKKFFGRGSEHFFKRPTIEARWKPTGRDDRGQFYFSSSLLTGQENLHTLYFYNYFKGRLRDLPEPSRPPAGGHIYVTVYSGSSDNTYPTGSGLVLVGDGTKVRKTSDAVNGTLGAAIQTVVTGGRISAGIYTASFAITGAIGVPTGNPRNAKYLTRCWDVWHSGLNTGSQTQYHTGTFVPKHINVSNVAPQTIHVTSITNLKSVYSDKEIGRFRLHVREKDWSPNIYTRASAEIENKIVESGSFRMYRIIDDLSVVPYGTGSDEHTYLSYDASGNFFDFDMKNLEKGYAYGLKLAYYNESVGDWAEQPETFKFRVE